MTKDEAIKILSLHLMQCGMMMPIEWVQKNGDGSDFMKAYEMAMDALKNEPVQEWISVKDRLPEKGEKVVACGAEGGLFIAKVNDCGGAPFVVDAERKFRRRATHWMPLPQPPKGE